MFNMIKWKTIFAFAMGVLVGMYFTWVDAPKCEQECAQIFESMGC